MEVRTMIWINRFEPPLNPPEYGDGTVECSVCGRVIPDYEAVENCLGCGKPVCEDCQVEGYCDSCARTHLVPVLRRKVSYATFYIPLNYVQSISYEAYQRSSLLDSYLGSDGLGAEYRRDDEEDLDETT
jgi:hypothetical protein